MGAIPGVCDTNNPKPAGTVSLLGGWPHTASSTTCLQVLAQCFDSENARQEARSRKCHASQLCTLCNLGRDCDQGVASLFNNEPFATGSSLFSVFPHDPSYNKGLRANSELNREKKIAIKHLLFLFSPTTGELSGVYFIQNSYLPVLSISKLRAKPLNRLKKSRKCTIPYDLTAKTRQFVTDSCQFVSSITVLHAAPHGHLLRITANSKGRNDFSSHRLTKPWG